MRLKGFAYIGFNYLQHNFGNEPLFMEEIVRTALSDVPKLLSLLERQLAERDWKAVGETAHQLKGVVQVFDLEDLALDLKQIQLDSLANRSLDSIPARVIKVLRVCSQVLIELRESIA